MMILPVSDQLYYFLTAIAGGLFIGIMFDIYRIKGVLIHLESLLQ
jgi:hypothetical protein